MTENKKGYIHHPETKIWIGKLKAMYLGHDVLVKEMQRRGYHHHSMLDKQLATGSANQTEFINTLAEQKEILREKSVTARSK